MGAGKDYGILTAATVRGNVTFNMGSGEDYVTCYDNSQVTGNVFASAAQGTAHVSWEGGYVGGNFQVKLGDGQSDATLSNAQVAGKYVVNMTGTGNKTAGLFHSTVMQSVSITTAGGSDYVYVSGLTDWDAAVVSPSIRINTGTGEDLVDFFGAVARDLNVTAGNGAQVRQFPFQCPCGPRCDVEPARNRGRSRCTLPIWWSVAT